MIIVKMLGGLGNQMSQYAFGKALATKHNTDLRIDSKNLGIEAKGNFTSRDLLLNKFNIDLEFATQDEYNRIVNISFAKKIFNKTKPTYLRHYVIERGQNFNPDYLKSNNNTYFEGYWICEDYYKQIRNELLNEFTLREKFDDRNEQCKNLMIDSNSVALHVRRGDFIINEEINKNHGTCGIEYYIKALEVIRQKVDSPNFFLFSDDPQWVKQNLPIENAVIVDWNGTHQPQCDLMLMSFAKHNIIANSTFSWWGAWLNQNPGKIIIAPEKWYNNPHMQAQANGIVPKSWIKL